MGLFDFILGTPEDRFAKRAMARLRERGWEGPLTYARDSFALETEDTVHQLSHIFNDWLARPRSERTSALDEALHGFFAPPIEGAYEDVAHLLLPVVRNLNELWGPTRNFAHKSGAMPAKSLVGSLGVAVAFDQRFNVQYVSKVQLDELERTFDEVLERAIANLKARAACGFELQADGYYAGAQREVYASSELLRPEAFQTLSLKGDPVVMVPARGILLVAGADDPSALEKMAAAGMRIAHNDNRPICFTPLVFRAGAWAPFGANPDAPLAIRLLHMNQQLWDYAEQHARLTADLESAGEDLFVAKFDVAEREGQILSSATWTDDVLTLLPKTDALILHDADWNSIRRRWEDVEAVCGPFTQEPDLDPPRFRTGAPPDAEAWRRLREDFGPPEGWPDFD